MECPSKSPRKSEHPQKRCCPHPARDQGPRGGCSVPPHHSPCFGNGGKRQKKICCHLNSPVNFLVPGGEEWEMPERSSRTRYNRKGPGSAPLVSELKVLERGTPAPGGKSLLQDKARSLLLTGYSPEPRAAGGPPELLPELLSGNHHLSPVVMLRGFLLQAAAQALHAGPALLPMRSEDAAGTVQVRRPGAADSGSTPLLPPRQAPEEELAAIRARLCPLLSPGCEQPRWPGCSRQAATVSPLPGG